VTTELDAALRQRVFDSVGQILPRVLRREVPAITGDTELMRGLGLRSATTLELLLELEDCLEIQIDVEEIDRDSVVTVGDLADYVASHSTSA
jgi:acyl carrier protein